jgi:hypothetical protein
LNNVYIIYLPLEGELINYYACNLIINYKYEMAIRVLNDFGINYRFEGLRGMCNKANIKKLLALAYFKNNSNWMRIGNLLHDALTAFTKIGVIHGVATCHLASATFMHEKTIEFVDMHNSEEKIIADAIYHCESAIPLYEKISHHMGHAQCLSIL